MARHLIHCISAKHKKLLLYLFILPVAGCATFGGRRQYVTIDTGNAHVLVRKNGAILGTTPLIAKLKRRPVIVLQLVEPSGSIKEVELHGRYRWGRSFAGNLLFLTYAPIGWVTDLLTGAAWYFPHHKSFAVSERIAGHEKSSSESWTLAVAPPISNHPNISDEVGQWIVKNWAPQPSHYRVLPYRSSLRIFKANNIDYDKSGDANDIAGVFYNLRARRVLLASVENDKDKIRVQGKIKDAFDPKFNQPVEIEIPKNDIPASQQIGIISSYKDPLYWLPNSIGLGMLQTNSNLTVNNQTLKSKPYYDHTLVSDFDQIASSVIIRHVFQPVDRPGWHYRWSLSPTLTFSYANDQFTDVRELAGDNFIRTHADFGYGPNFFYENRKWSFYCDIFAILGYNNIAVVTPTTRFSVEKFEPSPELEFGIMYYLNSHWFTSLNMQSVGMPADIWSSAFSRAEGQNVSVTNAQLVTTGLGIHYVFSSKDLMFWK